MKSIINLGLIGLIGCSVLFTGCTEEKYPNVNVNNRSIIENTSEFELIKKQTFRDYDAYDDVRCVYVLKDKITGKEYIGVSGIGISERGSHTSGKSTVEDER